ncbi:Mov34/MPN/PAD-1 family protein [Spiribacter halobius]|uniref:JAB domain-containing protein n=1 Tax=Sediminicurvatus halobius TaxID=2182432 RepID=A0A2U2MWL1_9GAMM|nr:Mov34/MPN/PAD-1 family protein [Spiribacter halobius]PWG61186.1 hypothetical protein DEM34_17760 [Spiribacter halobius]UEX79929.1 Mov34/MPN/PAD-1 family protein [Spiribacter halobius]
MASRDRGGAHDPPWAVQQAVRVLGRDPKVRPAAAPRWVDEIGCWVVEADFAVELPGAYKSQGCSPSGVMSVETVRFAFPESYPLDPPEISLREGFPRNFPHIQPWLTTDNRPVPCVVDEPLSEFFLSDGLVAVVHQVAIWLERAAAGTLIDPNQGWEPVRRDGLKDLVAVDRTRLIEKLDDRGGFRCLEMAYWRSKPSVGLAVSSVLVANSEVPLSASALTSVYCTEPPLTDDTERGRGVALLVWPGKSPDGSPLVCDQYLPETVSSLAELRERARIYGCAQELREALTAFRTALKSQESKALPLTIILCARRPYEVIGEGSCTELCAYVTHFRAPMAFPEGDRTPVRPAGLRDRVSRPLLARMSGGDEEAPRIPWTLVGAGSLGSKVGLHLARAGQAPEAVVDPTVMSPHNAARHALIPSDTMAPGWLGVKASGLAQAFEALDQPARAVEEDAASLVQSTRRSGAWSRRTWAVVNSSASLRVREALAAADAKLLPARVIEMLLFGGGQLGVLTAEGEDRNPNTADLMVELYRLAVEDADIRHRLRTDDAPFGRVRVGQGCGSLTMRMSDARISLFAAGMAEYLLAAQRRDQQATVGELLAGRLDSGAMGVNWERRTIPPVTVIAPKDHRDWQVRIHGNAVKEIAAETARYPEVETGGVIMGRVSETRKTFHVVDVLPAPPDSIRSPTEFILGTGNLCRAITEYVEGSALGLSCLGTWHSHLNQSGPSLTDERTAEALQIARSAPALLLIRATDRFHAAMGHSDQVNAE